MQDYHVYTRINAYSTYSTHSTQQSQHTRVCSDLAVEQRKGRIMFCVRHAELTRHFSWIISCVTHKDDARTCCCLCIKAVAGASSRVNTSHLLTHIAITWLTSGTMVSRMGAQIYLEIWIPWAKQITFAFAIYWLDGLCYDRMLFAGGPTRVVTNTECVYFEPFHIPV